MIASLPPTTDVDPLISCDLMDGRDIFLTMARDKHYEFSSLRRAKFSTMAMLVELHNISQDRFVYTCNECGKHVETRYHCTECEVRTSLVSPLPWGEYFSSFSLGLRSVRSVFPAQGPSTQNGTARTRLGRRRSVAVAKSARTAKAFHTALHSVARSRVPVSQHELPIAELSQDETRRSSHEVVHAKDERRLSHLSAVDRSVLLSRETLHRSQMPRALLSEYQAEAPNAADAATSPTSSHGSSSIYAHDEAQSDAVGGGGSRCRRCAANAAATAAATAASGGTATVFRCSSRARDADVGRFQDGRSAAAGILSEHDGGANGGVRGAKARGNADAR